MADSDEPLTDKEIAEIKRLFSNPLFIPPAFKTWMGDQLALNIPDLPLSSLFGGRAISRQLDISSTSVSAGGTGTLYTKKIPAGALMANGRLRFSALLSESSPDAGNDYFIDFCLAGTPVCTLTEHTTGTSRTITAQGEIYNVNDPAVQFGYVESVRWTSGTNYAFLSGAGSAAVDTRSDQDFTIQARWTSPSANDVITLTQVTLEIYNPLPFASA